MFVFVNKATGKILGVELESSEGAEFCNSMLGTFYEHSDMIFIARDMDHIKEVMRRSPEYYNSSWEYPQHGDVNFADYDIKELKVV
ncbi:hypothetical protein [Serratia sp. Se-RSBMAAmG]|uniref:hypothetical protein n=1 Tax=Serratia sp. Se-RSBMAAmG TaxID=3043305 RepID=UPI0024AFDFB9|nr:hypothetical protein [Serratia sp. Se-RSBMAAmG]MDI6976048.1 hypothetical protein [Serratia sp. Se-RSBMAAmG]